MSPARPRRFPALGARPRRFRSLTARLLAGMILPLATLALLLGLGGALIIRTAVETVNDRILHAASRAIADSLAIDNGRLDLDLSPAIFGMMEDNARDNVFYVVRQGPRALTGYADLPDIVPGGIGDLDVVYGYARYKGRDVRIVAEGRRLPGMARPLVIEVAETLDSRHASARRLLIALVALEAMLITVAALLLPLAVRWAARPLQRLAREMDARSGADLDPLPLDEVPAEVRALVEAFNGLIARLDRALAAMRRFTADASHQMRTPLTILRTHIGVLRSMAPPGADARASIEDIDGAAARLQHLLVQLLALARADHAASSGVAGERVDLADLVRTVAADLAPLAVRADIELRLDGGEAPVPALVVPTFAQELLANLVSNAIHYNARGGSVVLAVAAAGGRAVVTVEDDGPGIPPEDLAHVFEPFTRLGRDAGRPGSGLGLPIARMLAEAQGATLVLGQAAAGGLRAEVSFPAPSLQA